VACHFVLRTFWIWYQVRPVDKRAPIEYQVRPVDKLRPCRVAGGRRAPVTSRGGPRALRSGCAPALESARSRCAGATCHEALKGSRRRAAPGRL